MCYLQQSESACHILSLHVPAYYVFKYEMFPFVKFLETKNRCYRLMCTCEICGYYGSDHEVYHLLRCKTYTWLQGTYCPPLQGRRLWQQVHPKCLYLPTRLQAVIHQKAYSFSIYLTEQFTT